MLQDGPVMAYVGIGALLYLRTRGHFRDGRFFPRLAEFPRADLYTPQGQRRLRAICRFLAIGAPIVLILLWWEV